ncbi:phage baseplate assembly protein V [Sorangium sp. So ce281]|uniref:phage baseplate assembly protein V n=1 Tax=unclassified Sorangium TaxID=2621164 RepID=UPI003F5D838A
MNGFELLEPSYEPGRRREAPIHGVAIGVVTNTQDPEGLGRVRLKFPWLAEADESNWARVAAPMAGDGRGVYFGLEVDDEVLVAFEHGSLERPFVVGALWNGKDRPPAGNDDGKNNVRVIRSRSGHTILLDDTEGAEKITIADGTGKSTIVIDGPAGSIAITSDKGLAIQAKGGVTIDAGDGDLAIKCKALSVEARQSFAITGGQDGRVEAQSGLALECLAGIDMNSGALEVR